MRTRIVEVNEENIDSELLKEAAQVINDSGLVVFPTETVYGLGASALDPVAVGKIFKAKGRPCDNPLIVHVSNRSMIKDLIKDTEVLKEKSYADLMDEFWPGPLTIIFQKNKNICNEATAGLTTVGIRMPQNEIALKLIEYAKVGIAAPSANTSGKPSPTEPEHVIDDMDGRVEMILCAGDCKVGVESTVLDMTNDPPAILRSGGVSRDDIERVLGTKVYAAKGLVRENGLYKQNEMPERNELSENNIPKSPGMKYKHYAPKGEMIIFYGEESKVAEEINKMFKEALKGKRNPYILASKQTIGYYDEKYTASLGDRLEPETIAKGLYSALRNCDKRGSQVIFVEAISDDGIGEAVMNRLLMASQNMVIRV